jgi:hypothetical protein
MNEISLKFSSRPNLLRIYLWALIIRRKGLKPGESLPVIVSECPDVQINETHLQRFLEITGAEAALGVPVTYPELLVFPFHMPIIGHREFPLLYVSMMQIRNHVLMHRRLDGVGAMRFTSRIAGQRTVAKGLEMDVYSVLSSEGQPVWECLNTYYFRGRFGEADPPSSLSEFLPLPSGYSQQKFEISPKGGFRFGLLSGDYNGIHYYSRYARTQGFKRSFAQSYNSLTHCIRRLPRIEAGYPVRLDAAYKGPVYYNTVLILKYAPVGSGYRFDLHCEGDPRPCITARMDSARPGSSIMDPS